MFWFIPYISDPVWNFTYVAYEWRVNTVNRYIGKSIIARKPITRCCYYSSRRSGLHWLYSADLIGWQCHVRQGHAQLSLWLVLHRKRIKTEEFLFLKLNIKRATRWTRLVYLRYIYTICNITWLPCYLMLKFHTNNKKYVIKYSSMSRLHI